MAQQTNNIMFPADVSGCGKYRMTFPKLAMESINPNVRFMDLMKYITDINFFRDIRMVRLQRQVSDAQCDYFMRFLKPLSEQFGFWLSYELDDAVRYEDIPPYNIARKAFDNKNFFNNVKNMLQASDVITVTTQELKNYYSSTYNIPENKILVIANYIPRWWIGEIDYLDRNVELFKKNRKRPRIGFTASSSHFDINGINNYIDDFTHIVDFIRSTHQKYEWVFIGGVPKQLEDLAKDKKIEVSHGSDIMNYPRELWRRNLQCIVAPLQDNIFNKCKSNIKLIESWALGIPVIAQNICTYNKYTDSVFDTSNDLQNKLDDLFKDDKKFKRIIKDNRYCVDYKGIEAPYGYWLEKNLQPWHNLFTLPQKTIKINIKKDKGVKLDLS